MLRKGNLASVYGLMEEQNVLDQLITQLVYYSDPHCRWKKLQKCPKSELTRKPCAEHPLACLNTQHDILDKYKF